MCNTCSSTILIFVLTQILNTGIPGIASIQYNFFHILTGVGEWWVEWTGTCLWFAKHQVFKVSGVHVHMTQGMLTVNTIYCYIHHQQIVNIFITILCSSLSRYDAKR